jgi:hypothetical protein
MTVMDRFQSSIRRGTGAAVLIIQEHPEIDFSREILKAAKKYLGYDPQREGGRQKYLAAIIDISAQKDNIIDKLLIMLEKMKASEWDYGMQQVNQIVSIYAQRGNEKARKLLYKLYRKNIGTESALIEADGIDALKFITAIKGKLLMSNRKKMKDDWTVYDDYLIAITERLFPESNPRIVLEKESTKNPFIKRYLHEIAKSQGKNKKRKCANLSYAAVKQKIGKGQGIGPVKNLSTEVLKRLASDLLSEADMKLAQRYLRIFTCVPFPMGFEPLIKYALARNAKIRWQGIQALSLFKDKQIRQLAIARLQRGKSAGEYLKLLEKNFIASDNRLIFKTLTQSSNIYSFHHIGNIVQDIYMENRTRGCQSALLEIYNRGTCSICRKAAINIMIDNKVLPKDLKREIQFDNFMQWEESIIKSK